MPAFTRSTAHSVCIQQTQLHYINPSQSAARGSVSAEGRNHPHTNSPCIQTTDCSTNLSHTRHLVRQVFIHVSTNCPKFQGLILALFVVVVVAVGVGFDLQWYINGKIGKSVGPYFTTLALCCTLYAVEGSSACQRGGAPFLHLLALKAADKDIQV